MIAANVLSNAKVMEGPTVKSAEEEIWKFLTRAEKMNRTTFPDNSSRRCIIRGKTDGYGFKEKLDQDTLDALPVPESELRTIIKDINIITNKIYCTKRKNDEYDFLQSNTGLLKMIFTLMLVGFIILSFSDYYRENDVLFYSGLTIMSISGLLVVLVASLLTFKEKKHISLMKELLSQTQSYIDSKNDTLRNYKGAQMSIEKELRWIEIDFLS